MKVLRVCGIYCKQCLLCKSYSTRDQLLSIKNSNIVRKFQCGFLKYLPKEIIRRKTRRGCSSGKNRKYKINVVISTRTRDSKKLFNKVAGGTWHGAAINQDELLCVWGHSKGCGQEGGEKIKFIPPTIIPSIRFTGISCGFNYTLAWSLEGRAYSMGNGHFGGGHGTLEVVSEPKIIKKLEDYKIINMSAGFNHAGAVTHDGKLFMFGKGSDGALGFGKTNNMNNEDEPRLLVCGDISFISVSCSVGDHHGHTLAVSNNGHVYSWGDGYKGKLGHGDQNSVYTPTKINPEYFNNEIIIQISAGGIHSSALSAEGHVFTWGCGSDGRLGHPESIGHRYLYRTDIPKQVEELSKYKVIQISSSYYHTAALVE